MTRYLTDRSRRSFEDGRIAVIAKQPRKGHYDITAYQTTHLAAAPSWATSPDDSALNRYLQSWDVPNLFVQGATAFPQNARLQPNRHGGGASLLVGRGHSLAIPKNPGPMVHA